MKLGTVKDGSRDGKLAVVSEDLSQAVTVDSIAHTMQEALDNWPQCEELLQKYNELNAGKANNAFEFKAENMCSPLPRAYQWADGSAYLSHMRLVRKARGAEMPEGAEETPLMYQGGSDSFLTPSEDIPLANPEWGLDFEAEVAVITDDVPMGVTPEEAKTY